MSNICTTEVTFYTETSNLEELDKLFEIISKVTNDTSYDEKAISKELGFELRDNLTLGYSIELFYNEIQTHSSGDFIYFQIISSSKARPKMEIFDEILKSFENIDYVLLAEEPGREMYINTDAEHLFYDIEYRMETSTLDKSFTDFPNSVLNLIGLKSELLKNLEDYSAVFGDTESLLRNMDRLFSRKFGSFYKLKNYTESLSKLIDVYIGVFEYDYDLWH